jgi:hypothetical protein
MSVYSMGQPPSLACPRSRSRHCLSSTAKADEYAFWTGHLTISPGVPLSRRLAREVSDTDRTAKPTLASGRAAEASTITRRSTSLVLALDAPLVTKQE